jgi:hypothetical protein
MSNYDLLADLREWAESYDAVEIGADGVLYNAINRIEALEAALREIIMLRSDTKRDLGYDATKAHEIARAALGEKKDGTAQ